MFLKSVKYFNSISQQNMSETGSRFQPDTP